MTVYGHQRPAAGAAGPGGRLRDGALYGAVSGLVAVSWAFAAMAAVAALGIHLLGLDTYASLGSLTAALVAMAVGGRISPSGDVSFFGIDAAGAQGAIGIIPLGLSLVGAVVLAWLFVRPLRRYPVLDPGPLLARAGGAVVGFMVLLAVGAWAGNGTVAIKLNSLPGTGSGSGSGSGSGDPLGGLGGLIGNNSSGSGSGSGSGGIGGLLGGVGSVLGGGTDPTVGFKVDLAPTLALGLLWVLVVLALALAASRRCPLPVGWEPLRRTVRPVASAVVTVLVGAVLVGAVSGIVVGLMGNGGAKTVGAALLAAPNGVFLVVVLGMAVPFNGKASGPLAQFLPSPVDQLLKGGTGQSITLSKLAQLDGRVWLLPVAVALMLLAVGVVAAVRTPRPVLPQSGAREAAGAALRLGVGMAVVTPVLLVLADVSVNANLSVFGFNAVGAGLSISGNLLMGVVLGLVEGAVFGFLGALLVAQFASAKRVSTAPSLPGGGAGHGDYGDSPGRTAEYPAGYPSPYPDEYPATRPQPYRQPPSQPQQPPQQPYLPPGGRPPAPAPDNPYATPPAAPPTPPPAGPPPVAPPPGGYNPYSGGPAQTPPPPTAPPGR
ncbi:streptophobe family protein [Streptacidiphilus jeojiense]|uniref:streptophobe family protein n=1 Tax=Streptacidiphilus jeojiense TaxID=436229 RepID=UPI00069175D6|nr:streptophobe family protein [Streptacidiphilus jeojiense]